MMRFYLILAAPFLILFGIVTLLIRAQPYDDHELRALLTPPDCEMPCFLGVRPGVTSYESALDTLDAQGTVGWVTTSTYYYIYGAGKIIQWSWDGSEASILKADWSDHPALMQEQGGVIIEIDIPTNITLGDLWLILGKPLESEVNQVADMTLQGDHLYPKLGLATEGQIRCPLSLDGFWKTPQTLTFFYNGEPTRAPNRQDLSDFIRALKIGYAGCRG